MPYVFDKYLDAAPGDRADAYRKAVFLLLPPLLEYFEANEELRRVIATDLPPGGWWDRYHDARTSANRGIGALAACACWCPPRRPMDEASGRVARAVMAEFEQAVFDDSMRWPEVRERMAEAARKVALRELEHYEMVRAEGACRGDYAFPPGYGFDDPPPKRPWWRRLFGRVG